MKISIRKFTIVLKGSLELVNILKALIIKNHILLMDISICKARKSFHYNVNGLFGLNGNIHLMKNIWI